MRIYFFGFKFFETLELISGQVSFLKALKYGIIPLFLTIVFLLIITLLFNHHIHLEILKRKKSVEEATDSILTQLLFGNDSYENMRIAVEVFKFGVPYTRRWCRQFVLERILQMKQIFQLDGEILLNIYKLFEFEKITYGLLRHKKWYKRSLGIYQLQFLHDVAKKKELDLLLKERNSEVKSNALITLISFSPERFAILANYDNPLNKADEIKILDIIYHNTPVLPKKTCILLKSKNTSIVILGIKLLSLYQVPFSEKQVTRLVRFSNFRVRKEAIEAIGKLKMKEANKVLIDQYKIELHKEVKMSILVSFKNIGNQENLELLKSLLNTEQDTDLKFKIIDAIVSLQPYFFEERTNATNTFDQETYSMALHVKDPYLV